jgi:hypothetical protein
MPMSGRGTEAGQRLIVGDLGPFGRRGDVADVAAAGTAVDGTR